MKSPLKLGLNMMTLCLVSVWIYHSSNLKAINNRADGYNLGTQTTREIDTPEWCRRAYNPWDPIFVPTANMVEWTAFKAAAPHRRIAILSCPLLPPVVPGVPSPIIADFGGDGDGGDGGDGGGGGDGGDGCGGDGDCD